MPTKRLPQQANIDHLKYQAKDLLSAHAAHDAQAAQRIREFLPKFSKLTDPAIFDTPLKVTDAQLMIAREYGFQSWARLRKHLEQPADHTLPLEFAQAVDLIDAGDIEGLGALLQKHPGLSRQHVTFEGNNYFRNPTLLEFTAENPIRNGTLPANIVEVAKVLIDAGAQLPAINETLGLVCSGRVPRECGVQVPMIELLCQSGADPDAAMLPALTHGEFEAVRALLRFGAHLTLPVAAAIGDAENAARVLGKSSDEDRRLALAYAAQFGRAGDRPPVTRRRCRPERLQPYGRPLAFHTPASGRISRPLRSSSPLSGTGRQPRAERHTVPRHAPRLGAACRE